MMEAKDWVAVYAAVVATVNALWTVSVYLRDRYKLVVVPRYIRPIDSYVIEVANTGRRPVTVVGVGISRMPYGFMNPDRGTVYLAHGAFPHRLQERDSAYFQVPWTADGPGGESGYHAWVRDANGKSYTAGLPAAPSLPQPLQDLSAPDPLSADQLAQLFNSAEQEDEIFETKVRLASDEAKLEYYKWLAQTGRERGLERKRPRGRRRWQGQVTSTKGGIESDDK